MGTSCSVVIIVPRLLCLRSWHLNGPKFGPQHVGEHTGVFRVRKTRRSPRLLRLRLWPFFDPFSVPNWAIPRGFGAKQGLETAQNGHETGSEQVFEHPQTVQGHFWNNSSWAIFRPLLARFWDNSGPRTCAQAAWMRL